MHRDLIVALAAYPFRYYATSGGLVSYGPDTVDPYRRAAAYVDRILKGEKPADLPVQAPVKYELVVNQFVGAIPSNSLGRRATAIH